MNNPNYLEDYSLSAEPQLSYDSSTGRLDVIRVVIRGMLHDATVKSNDLETHPDTLESSFDIDNFNCSDLTYWAYQEHQGGEYWTDFDVMRKLGLVIWQNPSPILGFSLVVVAFTILRCVEAASFADGHETGAEWGLATIVTATMSGAIYAAFAAGCFWKIMYYCNTSDLVLSLDKIFGQQGTASTPQMYFRLAFFNSLVTEGLLILVYGMVLSEIIRYFFTLYSRGLSIRKFSMDSANNVTSDNSIEIPNRSPGDTPENVHDGDAQDAINSVRITRTLTRRNNWTFHGDDLNASQSLIALRSHRTTFHTPKRIRFTPHVDDDNSQSSHCCQDDEFDNEQEIEGGEESSLLLPTPVVLPKPGFCSQTDGCGVEVENEPVSGFDISDASSDDSISVEPCRTISPRKKKAISCTVDLMNHKTPLRTSTGNEINPLSPSRLADARVVVKTRIFYSPFRPHPPIPRRNRTNSR